MQGVRFAFWEVGEVESFDLPETEQNLSLGKRLDDAVLEVAAELLTDHGIGWHTDS